MVQYLRITTKHMAYTTNPNLPDVRRRAREWLQAGWSTRKIARHLGYTQDTVVKWSHRKHLENEPPVPKEGFSMHDSKDISLFIDWYNTERPHMGIEYRTPADMLKVIPSH